MKKLLYILSLLLISLVSYGQALDTIIVVGSDPNNRGGDSKKVTQQKTAAAIHRVNSITTEDSVVVVTSITADTGTITTLDATSITADTGTITTLDATVADLDSAAVGSIIYTDTYWDDLRVPLSNTKLNPTKSEPALEEMVTGVLAYAFEANADSTERLNFIAQLPHNRKAGTDLECHLHWSPSTTNTGDCYWRFTYTVISIDGTFGAATSVRVLDAGDGTALKHQLVELGWIDGANLGISSILVGNITRLGEHASDTFTGVAYGLEFDMHYEIDSPGSDQERVKY